MVQKSLYISLKLKLDAYFRNNKNHKVLISFSGGIDSTVLVYLVNKYSEKYKLEIHNLHVNYNMQENSLAAEQFCLSTSKLLNNFLKIYNVKLLDKNFESNARKFRYKKLHSYARRHNIHVILTAHHHDDQIETIYMNAMFNSDWISNVGIRDEFNEIKRPLLSNSKKEIIFYARKNKISYIDDVSNQNNRYLRNYIRNNILTNINKVELDEMLHNTKKDKIRYKLLTEKVNQNYRTFIDSSNQNFVKIKKTIGHIDDNVEFKFSIKCIILNFFNNDTVLTRSHWDQLKHFIIASKTGSLFHLSNKLSIISNRSTFYIYKASFLNKVRKNIKNNYKKCINSNMINWYDSKIIFDKKNIDIKYIRHWQKGDKYYSNFYHQYLKVSNLFVNNKISKFDKYLYPVIVNTCDEIICIPKLYSNFKNETSNIDWNLN